MAVRENYDDGKTIKGTSSADTIANWGSNVKIDAGKGNDLIESCNNKVSINAGVGNDTVYTGEGGNISSRWRRQRLFEQ